MTSVSIKKIRFDSPRCVASLQTIGSGQMVSKQNIFAPNDVYVNVIISNAAYTHSRTKVSPREGSEPSRDGEIHTIQGTSRSLMEV